VNSRRIVFSTKDRRPFLKDAAICERMHVYLKGICDKQNSPSLIVGGVEEHVHIACRLSKNLGVSKLIAELKKGSSSWIKTEFRDMDSFICKTDTAPFP
jgi:putative transposase